MTWVRLDDQFPEHPKVIGAGASATWLYVAGLCYCSRQLTDGRIPKAVVPRLTELRKPYDLAEKLVVVGLWREEPGCYVVHDYLEHQRSADEVRALSKARQEAGKRGGKAKANARRGASSKSLPDTEVPTEPELPPLTPPQSGREQNPRAKGENPRAVAAKAKAEKLRSELAECPECGTAAWNCTRCSHRLRELEAVAS